MISQPAADPEVAARLQPVLRPGESLLWSGKPDTKVVFRSSDVVAIPFSIVFLGIAIYIFNSSRSFGSGDNTIFELVGILFVVVGCYQLFGRFFVSWFQKRRSVYGVTNERAIALVGSATSTAPVNTGSLSVRRSMTGRHATVIFEPFGSYYQWQPGTMTGPPMSAGGPPTMGPARRRRIAPGAVAFWDVPAPDALLAAVNQAKAAPRQ